MQNNELHDLHSGDRAVYPGEDLDLTTAAGGEERRWGQI